MFWSQKKRLFRMLVSYGRYSAFAIDFLNHVLCCVYLHSRELNRHFSVGFWIIRSRYSFSTSHLLSFKPYNTHTRSAFIPLHFYVVGLSRCVFDMRSTCQFIECICWFTTRAILKIAYASRSMELRTRYYIQSGK